MWSFLPCQLQLLYFQAFQHEGCFLLQQQMCSDYLQMLCSHLFCSYLHLLMLEFLENLRTYSYAHSFTASSCCACILSWNNFHFSNVSSYFSAFLVKAVQYHWACIVMNFIYIPEVSVCIDSFNCILVALASWNASAISCYLSFMTISYSCTRLQINSIFSFNFFLYQ